VLPKIAIANLSSRVTLTTYQKRIITQSAGLSSYVTASPVFVVNYKLSVQLSSHVTLTSIASGGSLLCQCPPWINADTTVCGWEIPQSGGYTTVVGNQYMLPFTLPVFRLHNLSSVSVGGGVLTYDDGYSNTGTITPGAYRYEQLNQTVYNVSGSVSGAYTRKGCE
jgi:hypothetical protein